MGNVIQTFGKTNGLKSAERVSRSPAGYEKQGNGPCGGVDLLQNEKDAAHRVWEAGNVGVLAINNRERRKLRMNVLGE
jgi:hypothetical protein